CHPPGRSLSPLNPSSGIPLHEHHTIGLEEYQCIVHLVGDVLRRQRRTDKLVVFAGHRIDRGPAQPAHVAHGLATELPDPLRIDHADHTIHDWRIDILDDPDRLDAAHHVHGTPQVDIDVEAIGHCGGHQHGSGLPVLAGDIGEAVAPQPQQVDVDDVVLAVTGTQQEGIHYQVIV